MERAAWAWRSRPLIGTGVLRSLGLPSPSRPPRPRRFPHSALHLRGPGPALPAPSVPLTQPAEVNRLLLAGVFPGIGVTSRARGLFCPRVTASAVLWPLAAASGSRKRTSSRRARGQAPGHTFLSVPRVWPHRGAAWGWKERRRRWAEGAARTGSTRSCCSGTFLPS